MQTCHGKFNNCCRTCYLEFNDAHLFAQHVSSLHEFPVFGDKFQPKDTPTESAFGGNFKFLKFLAKATLNEQTLLDSCFCKELESKTWSVKSYPTDFTNFNFVQKLNCFNLIDIKKMALLTTSALKFTQTQSLHQFSTMECQTERTGLLWIKS